MTGLLGNIIIEILHTYIDVRTCTCTYGVGRLSREGGVVMSGREKGGHQWFLR